MLMWKQVRDAKSSEKRDYWPGHLQVPDDTHDNYALGGVWNRSHLGVG